MNTALCACAPCLHGLWATVTCPRCSGEGYLSVFGMPRADVACGGCRGTGRVESYDETLCEPCERAGCEAGVTVKCMMDAETAEAAQSLLGDADEAQRALGTETVEMLRDARDIAQHEQEARDERIRRRAEGEQ